MLYARKVVHLGTKRYIGSSPLHWGRSSGCSFGWVTRRITCDTQPPPRTHPRAAGHAPFSPADSSWVCGVRCTWHWQPGGRAIILWLLRSLSSSALLYLMVPILTDGVMHTRAHSCNNVYYVRSHHLFIYSQWQRALSRGLRWVFTFMGKFMCTSRDYFPAGFSFFPFMQMGRLTLKAASRVPFGSRCMELKKRRGFWNLILKTILNDISNESELTSFEATVLPRSCFTVATSQQNFLLINEAHCELNTCMCKCSVLIQSNLVH